MSRFVERQCGRQVTPPPECLDDAIGVGNPVRVFDAFVAEHRVGSRRTRIQRRQTGGQRPVVVTRSGAAEDLHSGPPQPGTDDGCSSVCGL